MLDTVKINHVQHISFTQPRLTDAVSVILRELLSYEHPSNGPGSLSVYLSEFSARPGAQTLCRAWGMLVCPAISQLVVQRSAVLKSCRFSWPVILAKVRSSSSVTLR